MHERSKPKKPALRNLNPEDASSLPTINPIAEQATSLLPALPPAQSDVQIADQLRDIVLDTIIAEETYPLPAINPIAEQATSLLPALPSAQSRLQTAVQLRETVLMPSTRSVVEQDTILQAVPPSGQMTPSSLSQRIGNHLPGFLQRPLSIMLERARDPEPEAYNASQKSAGVWSTLWGWFPLLLLTNTLGVACIALAFAISRDGGEIRLFLYPGLILIYAPTALRLISPNVSRIERISLICTVGISCYIIKVIGNPLYFTSYDEFLHWRTIDDIVRSGHLFSANPLLPVSSFYPGLEIVTDALSSISGLDTFHAGLIVIGITRLLMVLAIFAINEQVSKSARLAGIATILYIANSQFLLFDAQFAYESLALPLATVVLLALAMVATRPVRSQSTRSQQVFAQEERKGIKGELRWMSIVVWMVLIALALTHHVTDFFFAGLLILWAVVQGFSRLTLRYRLVIAWAALFALCAAIAYALRPKNPVVEYLTSFVSQSVDELSGLVTGSGHARQLFTSYAGPPTPLFERLLALSCVAIVVSGLVFGWLCIWKRYRVNSLVYTFGIVSLFYPILQAFRFTTTGEGLTDRSTSLLFIPISCALAIFIIQFWPARRLNWKRYSFLTATMTIMFLGGMVLGAGGGLYGLPGAYMPTADTRGIDLEGIQAAVWAHTYLGPNNRVGTDSTNDLLMGTYGNQDVVTLSAYGIDISPVFFSLTLNSEDTSLLQSAQVQYLVVDLRLAHVLPFGGYYFVQQEPGAYQHTSPIPLNALTKFNTIPQVDRTFDSGNIVIYNTAGLLNAPGGP